MADAQVSAALGPARRGIPRCAPADNPRPPPPFVPTVLPAPPPPHEAWFDDVGEGSGGGEATRGYIDYLQQQQGDGGAEHAAEGAGFGVANVEVALSQADLALLAAVGAALAGGASPEAGAAAAGAAVPAAAAAAAAAASAVAAATAAQPSPRGAAVASPPEAAVASPTGAGAGARSAAVLAWEQAQQARVAAAAAAAGGSSPAATGVATPRRAGRRGSMLRRLSMALDATMLEVRSPDAQRLAD